MKILHLNDHLSFSGGIETYLLSLLPALEALGHSQVVGFAQGDGDLAPSSRHLPLLARADSASRRAGYRQMADLLAAERPDVVHVHNVHNTGVLEACLRAVPTILHGHDFRYLCPASTFYFRRTEEICERTCGPACFVETVRRRCMSLRPPYAWTYYRRVRFVADNAERFALIIANSRYMGDRFVRAGFRPEQVRALPYFCPLDPLDRMAPLPSRPTILFIGRARPNKGCRYFVEALGKLPPNVQGVMVGDWTAESTATIRQRAAECGCNDRLALHPWAARDVIRETYAAATVVVVPSVWAEPLGIVGLESIACGVPVVACDVGGVREWLIDGETGHLVPVKDGAAIASAVSRILNLPDQGRDMGANGQALIRSRFSRQWHLDELMACYDTACAAHFVSAGA